MVSTHFATQYANANWAKQYLDADGSIGNRKILSLFGHKIDIFKTIHKVADKLFITKIVKPTDHANLGFVKAAANLRAEAEAAGDALKTDPKLLATFNQAIHNLNLLHKHVSRITAPRLEVIVLPPVTRAPMPSDAPAATPVQTHAQPTADHQMIQALDVPRRFIAQPFQSIGLHPAIPHQLDLPEKIRDEIIRIQRQSYVAPTANEVLAITHEPAMDDSAVAPADDEVLAITYEPAVTSPPKKLTRAEMKAQEQAEIERKEREAYEKEKAFWLSLDNFALEVEEV